MLELFPILRERLDEPAGNLSGGQQQMLALGMAFIEQPRLLMIDELSLGLAPTIVEQLLPLVRDFAAQGTTIILVEQSVNLALTIAETAYFMEKGEIRFHGPTAELLERPDVLRSVFLEGADDARSARRASRRRPAATVPVDAVGPTVPATPARVDAGARATATTRRARPRSGSGSTACRSASAGSPRSPTCRSSAHGGEIVGIIGPNGAGKTTLFDAISGFSLADAGTIVLGEGDDARRHHAHAAGAPRPARARPLVPGRPPVPVAHRRRDDRARVRAPPRRARPDRRRAAPAVRRPTPRPTSTRASRSCSSCSASPTSATSSCASCRPGAGASSTSRACSRTGPSVLLLDEPSSGIAQREAEALGPLLLRIREQTGATLLVIEHDVPLLLSVSDRLIALDLGEIVDERQPRRRRARPAVVKSYLGTTEAAIARSGARGPT